MIRFSEEEDQVMFEIIVQPRAGRSEVGGELDGALKIRIAAPPVEGQANVECERFLAKLLGIRRADIEIISGTTTRRKLILVRGLRGAQLAERLKSFLLSRANKG